MKGKLCSRPYPSSSRKSVNRRHSTSHSRKNKNTNELHPKSRPSSLTKQISAVFSQSWLSSRTVGQPEPLSVLISTQSARFSITMAVSFRADKMPPSRSGGKTNWKSPFVSIWVLSTPFWPLTTTFSRPEPKELSGSGRLRTFSRDLVPASRKSVTSNRSGRWPTTKKGDF